MSSAKFDKPDFGGLLRKKGGYVKAWRERWFMLKGKNLYYFKNNKEKRPTGIIDLTGAKVEKDNTKKWGFTIDGPNCSRKFELMADNETVVDTWIAKLNYNISKISEAEVDKALAKPVKKKEDATLLFSDESNKNASGQETKKTGLSDFILLTVLGRGSFGKVMKVRHKDTGAVYAMKVLRKDLIIREHMVGHTIAEKDILKTIDHPFIVSLRWAFQTPEKLYLVLDFLPGGELFFHLKEETKFKEPRAKFYAAEIALAIAHLHKNDIVYRDLKPENVVLDRMGHVVLTDFGLAKTSISNNTPTYTFCGTPEYLAPEILKGAGHAKAVDWWSLGVLLYEMLVGLPPFYSENINEMYELILKAPLKFPKFVSPNAQSLLRGLLERDETKRLGASDSDFEEIKNHPFFADLDWDDLYNRKIPAPFIPQLDDEDDTKYFDPEFTEEQARDSVAKKIGADEADFGEFDFAKQETGSAVVS